MKVSREMSSGESEKDPVNIETMGKELDIALAAIKEEAQFTGGELERIYGIFSNRIEKHL